MKFVILASALAIVAAPAFASGNTAEQFTIEQDHHAATSTDQAAQPAPAGSPSSDGPTPARGGRDKDIPVGFGWG